MTRIRTLITAIALGLTAAPALAGGVTFDLPRLQFPTDGAGATRGCHSVTTQVCAPKGQ
ncbi:hypothetical protein OEZ71_15695 [Defluviimonas sp. WL0050]|uniref:Uncharacterized protein n=1 Tax=Albidovulum litorale TaxID=2984134 RepID=A0ABT2ZRS2_9RHOB|nr:hypothetical protein [Defluviimonas sp. WL0050]MCV2873742.1 hypothetical protein [Defluviimonas sp. WL0050]